MPPGLMRCASIYAEETFFQQNHNSQQGEGRWLQNPDWEKGEDFSLTTPTVWLAQYICLMLAEGEILLKGCLVVSCSLPYSCIRKAEIRHHEVCNEGTTPCCGIRVQLRMSGNKLKLNPDKTEFLLIGHKRQRIKYLAMFPVDLLGLQTTSAKAARKLGVVFDTNFSFRSHVSTVCRSCRYHIRDLRRICRYLSFDSAKLLAHALVCSRLDYCNSILFGIADKETI